jgi:NAD(P)-dependent dehydrogenase (short-subunit alcohol dehydrogenase family)
MQRRLADKVALITGGAAGMGEAHVRLFAAHGAKVVAADIQDDLGRKVVADVVESGGEAIYVHLDTSSETGWANAVAQTVTRFGKLTTLCNVAGIYRTEATETETLEGWNRIIAVNQTGVWLGMKAAIPEMRKAGGGAIVNISSMNGIAAGPTAIAYHGSKAAVHLITKVAALEYAQQGIRVNSLHPGFTMTSTGGRAAQACARKARQRRAAQARRNSGRNGLRLSLPVLRRGWLRHRYRTRDRRRRFGAGVRFATSQDET